KPGQRGVLIDVGSHLIAGFCCGESQELVGSEIRIIDEHRLEGYTRVRGGWNKGGAYTVYFSAVFEQPITDAILWQGDTLLLGQSGVYDQGEAAGAVVRFSESQEEVQVKVGISYLSTGKAYANLQREIPSWDFAAVRAAAEDAWRQQLSAIEVSGNNEEHKKIFYTGLYHALLMPTDRTGENPLWQSNEPYYDDFYAIWDTYRATHPLYLFLAPDRQRAILQSLLDIYAHEGYLPDARSGNATGRTQGGSNVDVLFADALTKGLEGVDYEQALEAMIHNAEVPPGADHQQQGRGGLLKYNTQGYVSPRHERAGSRTVEYAYNDYCIYLVANALGKKKIAQKYLKRSQNWRNLWRPVTDHGATGFIMPRAPTGDWDVDFVGRAWQGEKGWQPVPFSPHVAGTWSDFFYEADSWEYSFYVPHDIPGLMEASGGEQAFQARLDTFFRKNFYNVGNEPSFLTPTLYNYLGRQDLTNDLVRSIIAERFTSAADGIPGNDDSGSMSAWVAFH
ncbi:MAG: GH92 family glycosyl hydrolase, partial [Bacteroidota bacterium]